MGVFCLNLAFDNFLYKVVVTALTIIITFIFIYECKHLTPISTINGCTSKYYAHMPMYSHVASDITVICLANYFSLRAEYWTQILLSGIQIIHTV